MRGSKHSAGYGDCHSRPTEHVGLVRPGEAALRTTSITMAPGSGGITVILSRLS